MSRESYSCYNKSSFFSSHTSSTSLTPITISYLLYSILQLILNQQLQCLLLYSRRGWGRESFHSASCLSLRQTNANRFQIMFNLSIWERLQSKQKTQHMTPHCIKNCVKNLWRQKRTHFKRKAPPPTQWLISPNQKQSYHKRGLCLRNSWLLVILVAGGKNQSGFSISS